MTKSFATVCLGVALATAGCSTVETNVDFDPQAQFAELKSYKWKFAEQPKSGHMELDNDLIDRRIRSAVTNELIKKGYTADSSENPDFWVAYSTGVKTDLDVMYVNDPYGVPRYADTQVQTVEKGALVLDIVDSASNKLIWRGIAEAQLDKNRTPEERDEVINDAVRKLLEKFPPEERGTDD